MFNNTIKICNLGFLILFSLNSYADSAIEEKEENRDFIEKIESGSIFNFADLKSDIISQNYMANKSFYFNIISKDYIPNLKLEYNDGSFSNKSGLNSGNVLSNKDISSIDINLIYGDVVSYYSLKSSTDFGLNLGLGLRQYAGEIEYDTETKTEVRPLNSTVPLSYFDVFYNLSEDDNTKIGTYVKESEFNSHSIKDTSIYFKTNINKVDNLLFIASYSTSNIKLSNSSSSESLIESAGINMQLKYFY